MPRDLVLDIDANAAGARRLAALDFAADTNADDVVVRVRPKHPARVAWPSTCDGEQLLCCRTFGAGQSLEDRAASHGLSNLRASCFGKYSTSRYRRVNQ